MKTIIIIALIVSACINCYRTSNSSKIATGCMVICVFTDSELRFPLGVCIDMAEAAIADWVYRSTFFGTVFMLSPGL